MFWSFSLAFEVNRLGCMAENISKTSKKFRVYFTCLEIKRVATIFKYSFNSKTLYQQKACEFSDKMVPLEINLKLIIKSYHLL